MLHELVDLFLQEAPQHIERIAGAIADPPNLAFHAHALKSMSLNLGVQQIIALSRRLEELGRSGAVETAPRILDDLRAAYERVRPELLAARES